MFIILFKRFLFTNHHVYDNHQLHDLLTLPTAYQSTRLYDVVNNHLRAKFDHQDAVLDCSFITATTALAGGLDGQLKMFDFNTHSDRVIGYHQDAIKCVEWNSEVNLAVSGWF